MLGDAASPGVLGCNFPDRDFKRLIDFPGRALDEAQSHTSPAPRYAASRTASAPPSGSGAQELRQAANSTLVQTDGALRDYNDGRDALLNTCRAEEL